MRAVVAEWSHSVSTSNFVPGAIGDAATGKEAVTVGGRGRRVWNVAFSPDGKQVASPGRDRGVRIWNVPG